MSNFSTLTGDSEEEQPGGMTKWTPPFGCSRENSTITFSGLLSNITVREIYRERHIHVQSYDPSRRGVVARAIITEQQAERVGCNYSSDGFSHK